MSHQFDNRFSDILSEIASESGFHDFIVTWNEACEPGTNFLSEILRARVIGTKTEGQREESLYLVKVIPRGLPHRKIKADIRFCAEVRFYQEVFPLFDRLQEDLNVVNRFKHCKVLKTRLEQYREVIIMEDLSQEGFRLSAVGKQLDLEHTSAALKKLGEFHALSFATRQRFPNEYKKYGTTKKIEVHFDTEHQPFRKKLLEDSVRFAREQLEGRSPYISTVTALAILDDVIGNVLPIISRLFEADDCGPFAVVNHGDLWTNNIMFKYENEVLVDAIFLDWQETRHCSPVLDLYYFMFTSILDDVRARHFPDLLQIYLSSLHDSLNRLQCSSDAYPERIFAEQLRKYCRLALLINCVVLPVFTNQLEAIDQIDISRDDVRGILGSSIPSKLYKNRVRSMMDDLIKHGLLC